MKKLLKLYGLNSDMQYYHICLESYVNGLKKQAIDQFKAMPRKDRKSMVGAMLVGVWDVPDKIMQKFFFDLL